MLHFETIEPGTLALLKDLQSLPELQRTRLVDGTALALQLGHRKSVDLDLFGTISATAMDIKASISQRHHLTTIQESRNINVFLVDGVKVDIVNHGYDWIDAPVLESDIRLAGPGDIAAMKISAIIGRGTKKDFVDLYRLLKEFSLPDILELYLRKYPDGSSFIAVKSLTYFDDANPDPMPVMLDDICWDEVKGTIREQVAGLF